MLAINSKVIHLATFMLSYPAGAGSWDRVVYNATAQTAAIKANSSDTGIPVPEHTAYRLMMVLIL